MLPADNHVHSEWSWDAVAGSMEQSCAQAAALGLPSITFTEHVDLTRWVIVPEERSKLERAAVTHPGAGRIVANVGPDNRFNPPVLDLDGYLAAVQRCRERFPNLRILSGAELGEPHWFQEQGKALLAAAAFDRVLGSLHSVDVDGEPWIVDSLFEEYAPGNLTPHDVFRAYLIEMLRLVESSAGFAVLAHIDYPIRAWPAAAGAFDPHDFEEELRAVLRSLAHSGRALEVNTRVPLHPRIVRWWHEAGGEAVSFGSDAHEPSKVAHDFAKAAAMVEAQGFRPGRAAHDLWART